MKPPALLLLAPDRADKAVDRAAAVRSILRIAETIAAKYGVGEGLGVLQIAQVIASKRVELKPSQSNEVMREIRRSVDETFRRLGDEATATDLAIELDLLAE
jgi:hypothetical protein